MNFVALKMLIGNRAKFLGLIFAVAFSSFLIAHQTSIFCGLMRRTASQIRDVQDADIWVMDRETQYIDEVQAMPDEKLYRTRSVRGVAWATPLFKGLPRAKAADGKFRNVILMGIDDATLIGGPRTMLVGSLEDLRKPDAVIIDRAGFKYFYPNDILAIGKVLEMNDRRVVVVGVCEASAPFATFPVMFTRYSQAVRLIGRERNQMSFILAKAQADVSFEDVRRNIEKETGLSAMSGEDFQWRTISYYIKNTGIPVNFGVTVAIAIVVGTVVAGQTFYLFAIDNLKQFAALKAVGVTNLRLVGMILLQALVVAVIGYSLGMAMCASFFDLTQGALALRGFIFLWQLMAGTSVLVIFIVALASLMSIQRVLTVEPATVFRG